MFAPCHNYVAKCSPDAFWRCIAPPNIILLFVGLILQVSMLCNRLHTCTYTKMSKQLIEVAYLLKESFHKLSNARTLCHLKQQENMKC